MEWLKEKTSEKPNAAQHEFSDNFNLLEVSARHYQDLFNNASDAIFIRDLKGNIAEVNEAAITLTGYTHDELLGMNVSEFLTAESFKKAMKKQQALLEDASANQRYDLEIIRKGGVRLSAESRTSLLTHNGRPLGVQCIVRDITERKRVEDALRFLSSVLEQAKDSVIVSNHNYEIEYVNKATEELYGYSREELVGLTPLILNAEPMAEDIQRDIYKTVSSGRVMNGTVLNKRKDGSTFVCDFKVSPLSDKDGRVLGYIGVQRDITERKRVEEALRESEKNFRNSLDNSPLGIRIVTAEGELLYANQTILDIYGYSSVEELKSVSTKQRYTPKGYAEHRERVKKRKLGKPVPADYEISVVRKDGEVRRLAVFRKAVLWDGKIQFQILYQDITEHKLTTEELRIFKAISDRAGYGTGIITPEGELIYINENFAKMHGYTTKELIGKHFSILHTKVQMGVVERFTKKLMQGGSFVAEELWHKKKDGTVFPALMTGTAIKDNMGKPLYLSATMIDITERKRVEMAVRQSEEFNSSLLTNSPSPILVLNTDASIRYVNPALEKLTGFSSAEIIGRKPPYPWWIEGDHKELSRRLEQVMRRGTRKYESLYRKKNGERFWVEKILKTVKANGEFKYYLVNWVDLTEQKRLKANMEFYLAQVTRAQEEERKRIAREIHDESIQSLATLALGIDAIAKDKEKLPKDIIRRLRGLRSETDAIADELRRFSHELRPGVIDNVGLVPALEILTEELNKENKVKVSLEVAGSERRLATNTELVLFRIAQEALRNIKRHSRATQSKIRLKFTREKVQLTVSDNGRGFEPPDTLSDLAAESKLGLIGIQERTRLLNGKLFVRSRIGRGTTVVVQAANIQGMKR